MPWHISNSSWLTTPLLVPFQSLEWHDFSNSCRGITRLVEWAQFFSQIFCLLIAIRMSWRLCVPRIWRFYYIKIICQKFSNCRKGERRARRIGIERKNSLNEEEDNQQEQVGRAQNRKATSLSYSRHRLHWREDDEKKGVLVHQTEGDDYLSKIGHSFFGSTPSTRCEY